VASTGGVADTTFTSVGQRVSNQTVAVTVANGRVTISGTGILLTSTIITGDTGSVTFNIYNAGN
jgi:hypothetical protein